MADSRAVEQLLALHKLLGNPGGVLEEALSSAGTAEAKIDVIRSSSIAINVVAKLMPFFDGISSDEGRVWRQWCSSVCWPERGSAQQCCGEILGLLQVFCVAACVGSHDQLLTRLLSLALCSDGENSPSLAKGKDVTDAWQHHTREESSRR